MLGKIGTFSDTFSADHHGMSAADHRVVPDGSDPEGTMYLNSIFVLWIAKVQR